MKDNTLYMIILQGDQPAHGLAGPPQSDRDAP
jgi:hypothetical protein